VKDETKMSATQQWMADHPNDVPCPKGNSAAWRRKRGLDKAGAALRAKYEAAMAEKATAQEGPPQNALFPGKL
jgi:hypothetical protein